MKSRHLLPLLFLALTACEGGSTMDTLVAHSDLTRGIMHVYERIFWWTALLFVLVQGALLYIVFRFRSTGKETTVPEQVHGNIRLELAWTIAPVFILLHIAIPTVALIFDSQAPAEEDAVVINATGKQWWFAFEYPEEGVITANEIHVPMNREVEVRLQSDNVIHAFWVPQLAAKRDMIPGRVNRIKFKAEKAGMYLGQCAEYCSDSHALMKFRVFVDTPEDYAKWVAAQKAPADTASPAAVAGFQAFSGAGCVACHAIDGTTAMIRTAPSLTHVGSRSSIAAGFLPHSKDIQSGEIDPQIQRENLTKWIRNAQGLKPGAKMPVFKAPGQEIETGPGVDVRELSDEQLTLIVDYLISLK